MQGSCCRANTGDCWSCILHGMRPYICDSRCYFGCCCLCFFGACAAAGNAVSADKLTGDTDICTAIHPPSLFLPLRSKMCLKNRHGEDVEVAYMSGSWVCPGCRGSCGRGCVQCCNCGPCRKKVGPDAVCWRVHLGVFVVGGAVLVMACDAVAGYASSTPLSSHPIIRPHSPQPALIMPTTMAPAGR